MHNYNLKHEQLVPPVTGGAPWQWTVSRDHPQHGGAGRGLASSRCWAGTACSCWWPHRQWRGVGAGSDRLQKLVEAFVGANLGGARAPGTSPTHHLWILEIVKKVMFLAFGVGHWGFMGSDEMWEAVCNKHIISLFLLLITSFKHNG